MNLKNYANDLWKGVIPAMGSNNNAALATMSSAADDNKVIHLVQHRLALRVPTIAGHKWITMDSSKIIPSDIVQHADAVIDVNGDDILAGPDTVDQLNTYHDHESHNEFKDSLKRMPAKCPTEVRKLIRLDS